MNGKQVDSTLEVEFQEWAKHIGNLAALEEETRLRNREREFALAAGYDFGYGCYWETMTLKELREAQS